MLILQIVYKEGLGRRSWLKRAKNVFCWAVVYHLSPIWSINLKIKNMTCKYCQNICIKKGKHSTGKQKYQCKVCKKYQQKEYKKMFISEEQYSWVYNLNNEGNSMSSIGRLLKISASSVQRVIKRISCRLCKFVFKETGESYEIDELCTFSKSKKNRIWIIYIINRKTGQIIEFFIGSRTKANIYKVLEGVISLNPSFIYTDRLNIYASLIAKKYHKFYNRCTNHIERLNLTLRTWLKRLSRKTICFSRSEEMLNHCFRLLVNKINTIKV